MSSDITRDARAKSRFLRPVSSFFKRRFALVVLVLFVAAGVWVLDDYGVGVDTGFQRNIGIRNLDYLLGNLDARYPDRHLNRFYGVSFELPLVLLERMLGLDDTRDIHLMRHLVTHLFFLAGGFFCYLLAYRLFGNRLLALLAMLLFLLHPRIYAHSFFNTKETPFLSMFMICLYLTHHAFDRVTTLRFLVLGVAMGILINLRIMGLGLFFAVVAMCLLDVFQSSENTQRKHTLTNMGVFILSSVGILYAVSPHLWGDPFGGFVEWFAVFSQHPSPIHQIFRGELILSADVNPPEFVLIWFSITAPPVAFVLGLIGTFYILLRGVANPLDIFANTRLRFNFLLVGCFVLPIVAVIVLETNVYQGWRQMYFIYAPFCLLAVFPVHWITSVTQSITSFKVLKHGAVVASVASTVAAMFSIHPHQHIYFNFLVDRTTPEHLRTQYDMDYWTTTLREGYEHLLERYPFTSIHARTSLGRGQDLNWQILDKEDRERLILDGESFDFYTTDYYSYQLLEGARRDVTAPLIHSRIIYGSKVLGVAAVDLSMVDDAVSARYREMHRAAVSGKPAASSEWDVYVDDATLTYTKESCTANNHEHPPFFLHVTPDDIDDLPDYRRRAGHATRIFDFDFGRHGVIFDGRCMAIVPLPDDGISGVRTGQFTSDGELWSVAINLRSGGESTYRAEYEFVVRDDPVISSEFNVYLHDGRLIYVKESCATSDIEAEFFLDIVPSDVEVLPPARVDSGFDHLDFVFETRGLILDDMCIASIGLPDYDIKRVTTGQLIADDGTVSWTGGYNVSAAAELPNVVDELRGHGVEPVVHSQFDVYLDDGRLIYFMSDCTADDADAPFFVHIYPADVGDLSPTRRPLGFESFSFGLLDQGVMSGDGCFTSFDLPNYDVAGFLTGQFQRDEGNLWEGGYSFVAAELPDVVERLRRRGAEPVIRSYFDVYLNDDRLIYVRDSCSVSDAAAKFFLHVVPSSVDDLPPSRVESGFDNLGFVLETHGLMLDGVCVASIGLPDYKIKRVRTGQWDPEQQRDIWKEEFSLAGG